MSRPAPTRLAMTVARAYHLRGLRQAEIAERLAMSQTRVSRLLLQAESEGIVRNAVVPTPGIFSEIEEQLEDRFGLSQCHVVDTSGEELIHDLGAVLATVVENSSVTAGTVGYPSWSRTLTAMVDALQPNCAKAQHVVELLGDLGSPTRQHAATDSTRRLASELRAEPVFLRAPGVLPSAQARRTLLEQDPYARRALSLMDDLDLAFVSIAEVAVPAHLADGDTFYRPEQVELARSHGAVGQICLRFIDRQGKPVPTGLDDMIVGVTLDHLATARQRWAAAGGPSKWEAIRAALVGGWLDILVTDKETADFLLRPEPSTIPVVGVPPEEPSAAPFPLDRDGSTPLYVQLADVLRSKIQDGEWLPEQKIPSEKELIRTYGISRMTVWKVLNQLVGEDLLYRVQGKGTFVAQGPIGAQATLGVREQLERMGDTTTRVLSNEIVAAEPTVARHLRIEPGEQVHRVRRLRLVDGEAISLHTASFPGHLAHGADGQRSTGGPDREPGLPATRIEESLESVLPTAEEAKLLRTRRTSPLLLLRQQIGDDRDQVVEYSEILIRGDRFRPEFGNRPGEEPAGPDHLSPNGRIPIVGRPADQQEVAKGRGGGRGGRSSPRR